MFGLLGFGKLILIYVKYGYKYDIIVFYDDVFVINCKDGSFVVFEFFYFDKINDYLMMFDEIKYFMMI